MMVMTAEVSFEKSCSGTSVQHTCIHEAYGCEGLRREALGRSVAEWRGSKLHVPCGFYRNALPNLFDI